ncbi:hypothetical protein T07_15164 [Trichinella nelsoni]|uniref:Uncharacterized protein n=2 Tax=Trichinella TaxID=6333 RepID=A0A0V0SMF6_9BILA|nr:hypothetical protein T07_15164 [Trichinella nelsoni]KRY43050.1 hypothetical protein T01_7304 [Trichinella spiralis]
MKAQLKRKHYHKMDAKKKQKKKKAYNNKATDFHYRIQECTEPTRLAKLWDNLRPAKQNADNE